MTYIMVDIEADGPIPGDYSMVCFGAIVVEPSLDRTFYGRLKPISDKWIPEALQVSGFTREETLGFDEPKAVMRQFADWITEVGGGSTLLTVLRGGEIVASQTHNLGSIRMQEMLATTGEPPVRAAQVLRQYIANMVKSAGKSLRLKSVRTFLAIGGDARFAAERFGQDTSGGPLPSIDRRLPVSTPPANCTQMFTEELLTAWAAARRAERGVMLS